MTEQAKTTTQPSKTQIRDLTPDELEQITGGGAHVGGVNILLGDGSVRTVDAGDYAVFRNRFGTGL